MTSKQFRSNSLFLRNEFEAQGNYQFPKISKQDINLTALELISYNDTRLNDSERNREKAVHFFVDDYRFEGIYRNPEKSISRLSQYRFLLTPDFSLYSDMPLWRQIENVAHNRWVGAYWQDEGLLVVPTISWSDEESFDFCFDGIEAGAIVAVGMIGCKHSKKDFLFGYDAMLERINPSAIIVFGTPFMEMRGNIIFIDYIASRKVVR